MANECPSRDELSGFILGALAEDQVGRVLEHVEQCAVCEETLQNLEETADSVVEKLRRPEAQDSYTLESNCQRVVALVEAIGRDPSFSVIGSDAAPAAEAEELGTIRSYRLLAKLGQGGMGSVYKALHVDLDKVVALKVLPQERLSDEAAVARFRREMKAVGKLNHPNIVQATDAGEEDGMHYLVMELVDGIDLSCLVKQRGPLPVPEACELIRQAALGLQHAHEHRLVHRDIKPSNLMLAQGQGGRDKGQGEEVTGPLTLGPQPLTVKILDMGLALLDAGHVESASDLTGTGQIMGTIDYMAPEQGSDTHGVDIRADVYSLGATLYKLLTGRAPFESDRYNTPMKKLTALATTTPERVDAIRENVPGELADLMQRMLSKLPEQRPATPAEVARLLTPFAAVADLGRLLRPAADGDDSATEALAQEERTTDPTYVAETNVAQPESVPATSPFGADRRNPVFSKNRVSGVVRALGGIAAVVLLGVIVFKFATRDGTVYVELDAAYDITRVEVDGNEVSWERVDNPRRLRFDVDPGEHRVRMFLGDETEVITEATEEPIAIAAGGKETIRAWLERTEIAQTGNAESRQRGSGSGSTGASFAVQFDGEDDYIETPVKYDGSHPITIEARVTPHRVGDRSHVVLTNRTLWIEHAPHPWQPENNRPIWGANAQPGDRSGAHGVPSDQTAVVDRSVHVAAVWDGTALSIFLDGKRYRFKTDGRWQDSRILPGGLQGSVSPFIIGADLGGYGDRRGPNRHFAGLIDEVRISSVARNAEDFTPAGRFEPDEHTLALYHFDEGDGEVLVDSSGNGHDGTIHGATWVKQVGLETWAPYDTERRAAEQVIRLGGSVNIPYPGPGSVRSIEELPGEPFEIGTVWLQGIVLHDAEELSALQQLERLRRLHCKGVEAPPGTFRHLNNLPQLSRADFYGTTIDDAGVAALSSAAPSLAELILGETNIGDEALRHVARLEHLERLELENCRAITDDGVHALRSLSELNYLGLNGVKNLFGGLELLAGNVPLEGLTVSGTSLTDQDFDVVGGFSDLRHIGLSPEQFTAVSATYLSALSKLDSLSIMGFKRCDLRHLERLPQLKSLTLRFVPLGDAELAHLAALGQLENLRLLTGVSDAALQHLHPMTSLRHVELAEGSSLTEDGVRELSAALPECEIVSPFGPFGPRSPGSPNFALTFDGVDDYVAIPSLVVPADEPITIEADVAVEQAPEGSGPILVHVDGLLKIGAQQWGRGEPYWSTGGWIADGGVVTVQSDPADFRLGQEVHLAAVYDGQVISLFVNGRRVENAMIGRRDEQPAEISDPITLRKYGHVGTTVGATSAQHVQEDSPNAFPFQGRIRRLRISNVARYSEDFTPVERFEPDEHTLALYHFDEGEGDVLVDASGNGHHGTIQGATWVRVGKESQTPESMSN